MYFGSASPSSYTVNASTTNNNVTIAGKAYLTFVNMAFQGANQKAFNITGSNHINFNSCDFSLCGMNGINTDNSSNSNAISYCTFTNVNNNAINASSSQYWTISNNTFTNIATVAGMGVTGDQQYFGMSYIGPNSVIKYNILNGIGYTGIHYVDGPITIQNNFITNFCTVKDDGGGIYTYKNTSSSTKTVTGNIVINGIGQPNGTPSGLLGGGAIGIYQDGGASNFQITNNTIANCEQMGILVNDGQNFNINNNVVYNNGVAYNGGDGGGTQIQFNHVNGWQNCRTITLTNNIFCARLSVGQGTMKVVTANSDIPQFFTAADYNYYARPMNDNASIFVRVSGPTWQSLSQWQSYIGKESHSKKSPKTFTNVNNFRFEYNASTSSKTISLGAAYMDIKGTSYPSSITLAPYTGVVLILSSGTTTQAVVEAEDIATPSSLLSNMPALSIYPNPVRDNFTLEMNNEHTGKMNVQVISQAGSLVRNLSFNKDQQYNLYTIPANDLPPGVYFINVQIGNWSDKRKMVKL